MPKRMRSMHRYVVTKDMTSPHALLALVAAPVRAPSVSSAPFLRQRAKMSSSGTSTRAFSRGSSSPWPLVNTVRTRSPTTRFSHASNAVHHGRQLLALVPRARLRRRARSLTTRFRSATHAGARLPMVAVILSPRVVRNTRHSCVGLCPTSSQHRRFEPPFACDGV